MPADHLPTGFSICLDPGLRRPTPQLLVGGAPLRILRLTRLGATVLDRLADGDPVPPSATAQRLVRRLVDSGMAHPRPPAGHRPGPSPETADVTIVIPVRDRPDGLRQTLARVGPAGAVLVVDDASVDFEATARVAAGGEPVTGEPRRPSARVVRRSRRGGPAAARNTGWREAATPLVAFVDADCQPRPGWLAPLVRHFADATVAAVAPRIVASPVATAPEWLVEYERFASPLDLGPAEAPVRPGSRVSYLPTAALVVRRTVLEQLGGFDESMPVGEDVDLVWRVAAAGWRVRYEPSSTVAHPIRPSMRAAMRQRFDYGRSAAPLGSRHGDAVAPLVLSGWSGAAWLLAGLGYPVPGAVVGLGSALALTLRRRRPPLPARELLRVAVLGHAAAGRALAGAVRRCWWPLALPLWRWPQVRPALMAVGVVPSLMDRRRLRPSLGPVRWTLLALADDLSYGAGVWAGVLQARSAVALLPGRPGARATS